jgi:putative transposase
LFLNHDAQYTRAFRAFLKREDIKVIRLPPRCLNLNAFAERFVLSLKEELIHRIIFVGEASLSSAIAEFMTHYHAETIKASIIA